MNCRSHKSLELSSSSAIFSGGRIAERLLMPVNGPRLIVCESTSQLRSGPTGCWAVLKMNTPAGHVELHLLLHFQKLVSNREFFHRHVSALRVEGTTGVLDNARAQQLPGLNYLRVLFILQRDRDRAPGVLVAGANLIQPLIEAQRANHAALERHVRCFVQAGDLAHAVRFRIAGAIFGNADFQADAAHLLKAGFWPISIARAQIDQKIKLRVRVVAWYSHGILLCERMK